MVDLPDVVITISGGVHEILWKRKGISVLIRDFDVEGIESDRITQDDNGDPCIEDLYEDGIAIEFGSWVYG